MSGAAIAIVAQSDGLEALGRMFGRLIALGEHPRVLWNAFAQYGETSTRIRFKNQQGPDGVAWLPSQRVKKTGGMTLQLTSRLLRSITGVATATGAEWGTNLVYAAVHQFGGKIQRAAYSSWLRLRTTRSGALLRQKDHTKLAVFAKATHKQAATRTYTVGAYTITIPARPYLGVNAQDGQELLELSLQAIDNAAKPLGGS